MKTDDLHPGQIPTTRAAIRRELWDKSYDIITVLLKCISLAPDSYGFINQAVVAASLLERVSCLVYQGKDGAWRKLPEEAYKKAIFEAYTETKEEVAERLSGHGDAARAFKTLWNIADLVCPMLACVTEQAFVSEYAYAIEYAVRHGGDLPKLLSDPDYEATLPFFCRDELDDTILCDGGRLFYADVMDTELDTNALSMTDPDKAYYFRYLEIASRAGYEAHLLLQKAYDDG